MQAVVVDKPGIVNVKHAAVVGAAIKCIIAGSFGAHKSDEQQGVMVFVVFTLSRRKCLITPVAVGVNWKKSGRCYHLPT